MANPVAVTKSYLVYYGTYEDRKVRAICISFEEAVEFMLTLMFTDRDEYRNVIRNKYNQETKTWVYSNNHNDSPCYYSEFDIEEWIFPSIRNSGQSKNPITYSINHDKKLCIYEEETRTYTVLPIQPESFENFDKNKMLKYNYIISI